MLIYGIEIPYAAHDFFESSAESKIDEEKLQFLPDSIPKLKKPNFFPNSLHPSLIVDAETSLIFADFLEKDFTKFRANLNGQNIFIYSCMREIICFDYENSTYERYDLLSPDNDISHISNLYLKNDILYSDNLFRIGDEWGCKFELIASDKFRDRYIEKRRTGLIFREALHSG